MLAPSLIAVLACPKSKQPLVYFPHDEAKGFLLCPSSRLRYRIDDGVPVLLADEAEELEPREVERLMKRAAELKLA